MGAIVRDAYLTIVKFVLSVFREPRRLVDESLLLV